METEDKRRRNHSQGVLKIITIESSNPLSPLVTPSPLALPSNRCVNSSGCNRSATPKERAAARTKRSRRVKGARAMTRRPETQTEAKRKVVTPPRTGFGTVMFGMGRRRAGNKEMDISKFCRVMVKRKMGGWTARHTSEEDTRYFA